MLQEQGGRLGGRPKSNRDGVAKVILSLNPLIFLIGGGIINMKSKV